MIIAAFSKSLLHECFVLLVVPKILIFMNRVCWPIIRQLNTDNLIVFCNYCSGGHSYCVSCGTVVEENTIVSSIEFQEAGDRSHVIGQFVSQNCSQPFSASSRTRGRFGTSNSRDATLVNIRRIISQVSGSLHLPPLYIDRY